MSEVKRADILLVDHDGEGTYLLERILCRAGFAVRLACNGSEVIQSILKRLPHFILVNWCLPGLNGPEFTRRIKQDPEMSHIVILAISKANTFNDRDKALSAGCDVFLPKPISSKNLLTEVNRWLVRRPAQEPHLPAFAAPLSSVRS